LPASSVDIINLTIGTICSLKTFFVTSTTAAIGILNFKWRQLLFTTPNIGDHISGAILYEETLYQDSTEGEPFVDVLNKAGIIPGIKVDTGLKPLCGGGDGETWCSGLDGLYDKCVLHYAKGARFAKWRTALRIDTDKGFPTDYAIDEAAHGLSRYARICQEAGLVPIVEPEILIDGDHDIYTTAKVQERVITTVYKKLQECGVMLEGTLLKPSMTVCGVDCKDRPSVEEIGALTVQTLSRSIPSAMPGVTFLSGGISEEDSSIYLNEINKIDRAGTGTFALTFSFSRALQSSCLKTWDGKKENVKAAQDQLFARAKANSEASNGEYTPGSQPSMQESLYVKNYVY
jgi:fructose-bisphosphate aldolase class I